MKKILQFLTHRLVVCVLLMLVQAAVLVVMILEFQKYFGYFYIFCIVLSVLAVLHIINNRSNPAYKIAWIIPILTVPVFGGLMYLIFGGNRLSRRERKKMSTVVQRFQGRQGGPQRPGAAGGGKRGRRPPGPVHPGLRRRPALPEHLCGVPSHRRGQV